MVIRVSKFAFLVPAFLSLLLIFPSASFCRDIMVQPGKFDHFDIKIPQKIVAGDKVQVEITAVDSFNNIIPNFTDSHREFTVSVSGSAAVTPSTLSSSVFVKGFVAISLRDTAAESFTMTIFENGNTIPLQARDVQVIPGKLASLIVRGPNAVPAGDKFDVKILSVDAFGNAVSEQISGKNINILFKGGAEPKIIGESVTDFRNGVGTVTLTSEKAGAFAMEAVDLVTGSIGTSEWIEVVNNNLASFKLMGPKVIIAGDPFEISIVAIDKFNNIVKNYALTGSDVTIISSGKARPFPSTLSAYEFVNGQAKATLRYDTTKDTHELTLTVSEVNGKYHGTGEPIKVLPQIPSKYEVVNPESAIAGQKFMIKVTVYNQNGNPIKNYNLIGPDVLLSTTGSGKVTPNRIPAAEFVNGTALVDVQCNKSETFTIVAEPVTSIKSAEKNEQSPKKEATSVQKKIEVASETAIVQMPKSGISSHEPPLDITGISLVESKKRTVVSIHIPGLTPNTKIKYTARSITMDKKKWIVLAIRPASSRILEPVRFDSLAVGKVVIEADSEEAGSVRLKIENIKAAKFRIQRSKKSIEVMLTR